jgi:hypothetical protein
MSTLVVETIKHTNDTTLLASDTSGQLTVKGEGTATTNLQQGLAKVLVYSDGAANITDSLNISSGTDRGTGTYQYFFANNLANTTYYTSGSIDNVARIFSVTDTYGGDDGRATNYVIMNSYTHAGSGEDKRNSTIIHGDLA